MTECKHGWELNHPDYCPECANEELLDAIEQALDDFDEGHSVCEATKQLMTTTYNKYRKEP